MIIQQTGDDEKLKKDETIRPLAIFYRQIIQNVRRWDNHFCLQCHTVPRLCSSTRGQLNSAYVGSRNYEWWKQIVDELLACVEGSGSTSTDPAAEPTQEPGEPPTTDPAQAPSEEPTISKPVIQKQPKNLTVKAKGEKLKYQWYYRTSPTAKWKKVTSKGKSATLTFKAKAKQNGWQYRCLVKNSAGQVYTKTVKLKVKKK